MTTPKDAVPPRAPEDLSPDPTVTYDPSRSLRRVAPALPTSFPTAPAVPPSGSDIRSTSAAPAIGGTGRLTLLERLAQGGFGDVWLGFQEGLERTVAVKRLRQDRFEKADAEERRWMVDLFRQEALTTAQLEHPNIVPIYQLDYDRDGRPLLGMKHVSGRPWNELIREELDQPVADFLGRHLPILINVAQAVAFAHSKGILHRDLKPQQVMVGEFGEVLLMDWGLATFFGPAGLSAPAQDDNPEGSASWISTSPGPAGTPAFMAPEQTRGELDELGPWTDVYLLGGTLYYLLTGSPPHKADSSLKAFRRASQGDVEPPIQALPQRRVPQELNDLAVSSLHADPEHRRPNSAEGFIEALESYLTGASRRRRSRHLTREIEQSEPSQDYSVLAEDLSRLQEAQALWPENPRALDLRQDLLERYAESALANNDLALARLQAEQLSAGRQRESLLDLIREAGEKRQAVALQRRWALIATSLLALLLLAGGIKYTWDQRRSNQLLVEQRDAERRARSDAEGLMAFMLEDLWARLEEIERADLMAPVARRADDYYSRRDPSQMSAQERHNRGVAFSTIGDVLHLQGDLEEALVADRKAIKILSQLHAESPTIDTLVPYLVSLSNLAINLADQGDGDAALARFEQLGNLSEEALREAPDDIDLLAHRMRAFDGAGIIHYDQGNLDAAHQAFVRAVAIARELRGRSPGNEFDLANISLRLAVTLSETGRPQEALLEIEGAITTHRDHMRRFPEQEALKLHLLFAESVRSEILAALGRPAEATATLRSGIQAAYQLVEADPTNAERRYLLGSAELVLAELESSLGNLSAAQSAWQRVADLLEPFRDQSDNSYLLDTLARALIQLGRIEEARAVAEPLLAKGWKHRGFDDFCREHGILSPAVTRSAD